MAKAVCQVPDNRPNLICMRSGHAARSLRPGTVDTSWAKKAPAGEDRQALPARKLVKAQPVQLIVSTNRENYNTLNSYQQLIVHRPCV